MSRQKRSGEERELTCDAACEVLETALKGSFRRDVLDGALRSGSFRKALRSLRADMRSHSFQTASHQVVLGDFIRRFDGLTREEGFEVLHTWDHSAHRFCEENAPVLTLDYFANLKSTSRSKRVSLSILLDFYFLHVLILCAVRVWDEGDPDGVLDRVTSLLRVLQGSDGSGHHFAEDGETLLMLAMSQFHPNEQAYDHLIEKIWTLNRGHVRRFALISTAVLGAHLRWGFRVMYRRDVTRMRDDNVPDYPWLLFALETLLREYARLHDAGIQGAEREEVVEGLLNGLTPDPWAFIGKLPDALSDYAEKYSRFCELLGRYGEDLVEECKRHRPSAEGFSPMAFHFNFPHNVLMAHLMTALDEESVRSLSLNALLLGRHDGAVTEQSADDLAKTLTAFAGSSPDKLDAHGARLIIYDWHAGHGYCNMALTAIGRYVSEMAEESRP